MSISFKKIDSDDKIKEIEKYDLSAFINPPDFNWGFNNIKQEMKHGWQIYAVCDSEEIISTIFFKEENGVLLTKDTALKMDKKGLGYSHSIKNFIEQLALEKNIHRVEHICSSDNFRAHALNESHGYNIVDNNGKLIRWQKVL